MQRLEIYYVRSILVFTFLVSVAAIWVAHTFLLDRWLLRVLTWTTIAISPLLIKRLFHTEPVITVDELGVHDTRTGFGLIPWKDIRRVHVVKEMNVELVCLDLVNIDSYLRNLPAWRRWSLFLLKRYYSSTIQLNTYALSCNTVTLLSSIIEGSRRYGLKESDAEQGYT